MPENYYSPNNKYITVWGSWTSNSTTANSENNIWTFWCDSGTNAATSSTIYSTATSGTVWVKWINECDDSITDAVTQTKEQRQAARQRELKFQRLQVAENRRREIERIKAEKRANRLLLSLLNRRQKKEYANARQITIFHNGTDKPWFILSNRQSGNILEHDKSGKPIIRHCVHPVNVPLADVLATQMLYLKTHPEELLQVANHQTIQ
jgi:hypothetical protein